MQSAPSEDKPFLEKAAIIDGRLTLVYLYSAIAAGSSYLIAPIIKAAYEIQTTGNATWVMPMRSVYVIESSHVEPISKNIKLTFSDSFTTQPYHPTMS